MFDAVQGGNSSVESDVDIVRASLVVVPGREFKFRD